MSEYRMLFSKEGTAAYISHLDLLRTFQRVFIRAGLVIRHSSGFHPHPVMSFVLPLSVGQSSSCELLDFETVEDLDAAAFPERLNPFLPEGVRVLDCWTPVEPVREMKLLRADVTLEYDRGVPAGAGERMAALLLGESVVVAKRNKKKQLVDADIRPMIESVVPEEQEGAVVLHVTVQGQNPGVNPALLAAAVERHLPALKPDFVRVRRRALLNGAGELFR